MESKKLIPLISIFLLLIASAFLGFQLRDFTLEGKECVVDPFVWGAKKFVEFDTQRESMECSCTIKDMDGFAPHKEYYFTNDGVKNPKRNKVQLVIKNITIS